ncbi:hypothetical protein [Plasticicumulans sp.]|uniref:hypothetical protein n=1 Tax=Plasticicumulans sp. TaxID=2307179 RepID=UPI002CCC9E57|nr:hypothetical protein [Plasticicumulans sp.]MBS0602674.1 hypothetical protein [Pseudomonadota bacterium]HNB90352.1 hypothetical protein [Plasticicumulans sp.]HND97002.1 hypothetical protein [Plasticicumulans sp.]HNF67665.1 hypothetical protein [Plasticicumulans sp.]HNJ07365.1 hypothetical protein [Plasticicumulans sp.]
MSLPADLLKQAEHLARKEPRRPSQASLRRAVSAAYYALFHRLIEDAAARLVPGTHRRALRQRIARACEHGEMRRVCERFAQPAGRLPPGLQTLLPGGVPPALQQVAATFVELQEARHEADYNLASSLTRTDAQRLIELARRACSTWVTVRECEESRVFLLAFLFFKQLQR